VPPKPKRTATPKSGEASKVKRKPRQTKRPAPKVEPSPPAPPPAPAPAAITPVSERWTIGTALVVVAIALAVVVAAFGVVKLLTGSGTDSLTLEPGVPTAASPSALRSYSSGHGPVYWIGPPENATLEVTRTSRGVYVRYLTGGAEVGDKAARYTTVGTYPLRGAYQRMTTSARSKGFGSAKLAGGGLAAWNKSAATSVYLAYPRRAQLIEVYDPSAQRARALALSGVVQRVR
jgi:hypothetical protein